MVDLKKVCQPTDYRQKNQKGYYRNFRKCVCLKEVIAGYWARELFIYI